MQVFKIFYNWIVLKWKTWNTEWLFNVYDKFILLFFCISITNNSKYLLFNKNIPKFKENVFKFILYYVIFVKAFLSFSNILQWKGGHV